MANIFKDLDVDCKAEYTERLEWNYAIATALLGDVDEKISGGNDHICLNEGLREWQDQYNYAIGE